MAKIAVRLLMLLMFTTPLVVAPVVTDASAATTTTTKQTSNKHVKKKVRVTHQTPGAANPPASPYGNRYEDDPDRRAAGGGY